MRVYGLRAGATGPNGGGAGLDVSSLLTLQSALRRAEFQPVMTDAPPIVAALVGEFPHQDGAGFLKLVAYAAQAVAGMTSATVSRAKSPEGTTYYVTGAASGWEMPPAMTVAMDALKAADRASRLLDDAAVIPAAAGGVSGGTLRELVVALHGQIDDAYVAAVLLSCVAKLTAHPLNAAAIVAQGLLPTIQAAVERHASDMRVAEVAPLIYFNVGRDLDASDALVAAGAVTRVVAIAHAWMKHAASSTGSPAPWAPEGSEDEVGEVIVLEGQDRYARERNAVRPRLVRTCVNVLINLACARKPLSAATGGYAGHMPVDVIVASGGVQLLADVLLGHLTDAPVVTAVLNAAANVAFKNPAVQLALGERMMDAVLLAGWQFGGDAQLLSMALRTIGNLTNQDANIYRCLGLGAVRMIASAMALPVNEGNTALLSLAASVLSNIASVEPTDEASAEGYHAVYAEARAKREGHASAMLRPTAADAAAHAKLVPSPTLPVWCFAHHLVNDEGASAVLGGVMARHSTDVGLAEACLRTLLCVASGNEDAAAVLVSSHDVIPRTLFVMRAADFDAPVQLAGAQLLQALAANSQAAVAAAVVSSDAALTLCSAAENHKGGLLSALASAVTALNALPPGCSVGDVLGALDAPLGDAKARASVQLLTRVFDCLQLLASPRAVKAIQEMGTVGTGLSVLSSGLSLLHMAGRKAGGDTASTAGDTNVALVSALVASGALALSNWAQAPLPGAGSLAAAAAGGGPVTAVTAATIAVEASQVLRSAMLGSERTYTALGRLLELCTLGGTNHDGSPLPGDPPRPAVHFKPVRALVDLVSSLLFTSPVLPGRAPPGYMSNDKARLNVEPAACAGLVRSGGLRHLGALMAANVAVACAAAAAAPPGTPPDTGVLTSRMLAGQLMALVDIVAVGSGGVPSGATDPLSGGDPASLAATMLTGAQVAINHAGVPAASDIVPSPVKLAELATLASRAAEHARARASSAAGGTYLDTAVNPPSVLGEVEAAALFTFSITRARQGMAAAAASAAAAAIHGGGAKKPAAAAAAAPPAPKPLKEIVGLKLANGWTCTAWLDGKPHEAGAKAAEDCSKLIVYDAKTKAVRGMEPPTLATLRSSAFVAARVGVPIKGKKPKPAGMFGKAANPKRTVCCDNDEDTLLQLECADEAEAGSMAASITSMLAAGRVGHGGLF
jgi:hypothetical protein